MAITLRSNTSLSSSPTTLSQITFTPLNNKQLSHTVQLSNTLPSPLIGSYRHKDFQLDVTGNKIFRSIREIENDYENGGGHLYFREIMGFISMTEMRVEDYYLIRSKLLDNRVYGCLNKAIQGEAFNGELLHCEGTKQLKVPTIQFNIPGQRKQFSMMGMGSNTYSFRNQNQNQNLINIGNYTQQPSTPTFNNEQNMIQQLPMMNYQPQTQFGSGINTYVGEQNAMVSPVNRGNIGIVQQMGEVGRMGYNQMGNIGQNFGGQQQIHQTQYGGIQSGNWNSNCWNMSPIQAQQVCNMNALQTQPYYPSQQQQLTSNNQGYQNNGLTIPTYPQTNNYPLVNNAYPYNNSLATGCPAATMLPTMTAMTSLSCLPIYDPSIPIIPERLSRPQISLIKAVAQEIRKKHFKTLSESESKNPEEFSTSNNLTEKYENIFKLSETWHHIDKDYKPPPINIHIVKHEKGDIPRWKQIILEKHKKLSKSSSHKSEHESERVSECEEEQHKPVLKESILNYKIDLIWSESPVWEPSRKIEGSIMLTNKPKISELSELIMAKICCENMIKDHAELTLGMVCGTNNYYEFVVDGTLQQRKINVGEGYSVRPLRFEGFKVDNLTISCRNGSVCWLETVDVEGVDFSKHFKMEDNCVECSHESLNKRCKVRFYTLPMRIRQITGEKGDSMAEMKLKNMVERQAMCKFVACDMKSGWYEVELECFNGI